MGRKVESPRYNVLSCRVSDELKSCVQHALGNLTIQDFLTRAITDKLIADRQARLDDLLRSNS